jgi:cellulose synthase/poly-beta-1,6-N-acetylglucosamine synthase-like glycosyltransferase
VGLLVAAILIETFYCFYYYLSLVRYRARQRGQTPPVSIIICARNEAPNLAKYLPAVLNQDYPEYEVIVVDHASSDATPEILHKLRHDRLRTYRIADVDDRGKRTPLAAGIEAAHHDRLVFTDADCAPASRQWLGSLVAQALTDRDTAVGYSPYANRRGWFQAWVRFDNGLSALQYLSFAIRGHGYMGVGRNLSYSKELFRERGGFGKTSTIGGDDDLLVSRLAPHASIRVNIEPEAFCVTEPPRSLGAWLRRKVRHLSTATRLDRRTILRLSGWHIAAVLHYTALVALLASGMVPAAAVGHGIRLAVVWPMQASGLRRLRERGLGVWIPLFDLCHALYLALFAPALFAKPKQWT